MPASGGGFSGSGGFDVEPLKLVAGSVQLAGAAEQSVGYGRSVAGEASADAAAIGVGPLAGALARLGAKAERAAGELAGSLSGAEATLEASAEAYARSDRPLV